ncbi:F0F1 ATP synthase subunit B [Pseudanabaena sp. FACHB-2040]|uniref:F0F1 ATP synthase subunit B n=1 Tax=Pseudanabaena sp. FACHB-2040 TaxID=2692859 RepID=UPI00168A3E8A|nr:F0F1 ATP synthase subunit B [Pseudanabaena sp. FACHB-2040]MBD0267390.1 F0F1 ATP synthase subunit B [Cyanobacteria bacterium Co-bin8]MBD2260174.1 F0F1 ATP synthase subunit B [Pseudanabaena sp. FACHB-2040]
MDIGWFLATEGGFGLNFDILETNLINLALVIGILVYFGRKFLGNTLSTRKATIEESIRDAERRKQEAASALAEQQQRLALAQDEAQQILANGEQSAARAREAILMQAQADVERLKANAAQDLTSQQERIVRELRQQISAAAVERAEAELPNRLQGDVQTRLVDASIAQLGGDR